MATPAEVQARLSARQDAGVTGVAHVMLDGDLRVGTIVYVEESMGWEAFEITREGRWRQLQRSPIDGYVEDWQACARSTFPELAERVAPRA
jgi:hypothetical protein